MEPLLYTTRLRKAEYLGGRYLAALAINAIVVLAIPLGFWIATLTIVEADALGPNRLAAYVQPLLLFVWPNIVLVGAIQFTMGALARQVIPVYAGTAAVFIGYIVAANYWNSIESPLLSALADPLAINALLAMSRYRTPAELEARLVGFPALLVRNRVDRHVAGHASRARRVGVARTDDGQYEVTLDVVAKKLRADSAGRETETPMDDVVELGVFAPGAGDSLGVPLHLRRHRIRSGKQTIRITAPREPARAGIDPFRKLIEREREDNVIEVTCCGTT